MVSHKSQKLNTGLLKGGSGVERGFRVEDEKGSRDIDSEKDY